jgi:hypothetical protein
MGTDRAAEIERLLERAKEAHGEYERTELNGVYDEDWPRWYADFAVNDGLGSVLGREVSAEEVADFFVESWNEFKATVFEAEEVWTAYTARRMVEELAH